MDDPEKFCDYGFYECRGCDGCERDALKVEVEQLRRRVADLGRLLGMAIDMGAGDSPDFKNREDGRRTAREFADTCIATLRAQS